MPTYRLIATELPDLLPMQNRTKNVVHLSAIIHYLCLNLGYFTGDAQLSTTWAQLGCAHEHAIIARKLVDDPSRYVRPHEVSRDDIYGNLDLLDVRDFAVEEVKLSWMSARHDITSPKLWRYRVQLMAYCHMVGTDLGRLNVTFVNGLYKGAGPIHREWECEFTSRELRENWNMLRTNAKYVQPEV